jgi:hypothetical protein
LPREETTPPVIKINRVMDFYSTASGMHIPWENRDHPSAAANRF